MSPANFQPRNFIKQTEKVPTKHFLHLNIMSLTFINILLIILFSLQTLSAHSHILCKFMRMCTSQPVRIDNLLTIYGHFLFLFSALQNESITIMKKIYLLISKRNVIYVLVMHSIGLATLWILVLEWPFSHLAHRMAPTTQSHNIDVLKEIVRLANQISLLSTICWKGNAIANLPILGGKRLIVRSSCAFIFESSANVYWFIVVNRIDYSSTVSNNGTPIFAIKTDVRMPTENTQNLHWTNNELGGWILLKWFVLAVVVVMAILESMCWYVLECWRCRELPNKIKCTRKEFFCLERNEQQLLGEKTARPQTDTERANEKIINILSCRSCALAARWILNAGAVTETRRYLCSCDSFSAAYSHER